MTDTPLKTLDPFAMPAPPAADALEDARLDAISARNGFETAPPRRPNANAAAREIASKAKPRRAKPKPKPAVPKVNRMRKPDAEPKAQFNQRVPVAVANGFYDYQRETGVPMWKVLERAYEALRATDPSSNAESARSRVPPRA